MKKLSAILLTAGFLTSISISYAEAEVRIDGAAPGQWTMDFDAAKKVAAEKKLPILLNFTGSDWCGWCKLMEKAVFSKETWKDYASGHIMMVTIDFPSDKSKVPQKYVARNKELQKKYEVQGFPTFVILDDDGETEIGRLGAGRDKTPESFIAELKPLFRYRDSEIEKYSKTLTSEDAASYKKIVAELQSLKDEIARNKELIQKSQKAIGKAVEKMEEVKNHATEFRASKAGGENHKRYLTLSKQLKEAEKELQDWLNTNPVQNEENGQKFIKLSSRIGKLKAELGEF